MAGAGIQSTVGNLTIAHSLSNENKALNILTDRILVRLDITGLRRQTGVVDTAKASAYLVVSAPRGVVDPEDTGFSSLVLLETLLGVVAVSPTAATLSEVNIARILAGEP